MTRGEPVLPDGFSVRQELHDLIYRIDPNEARLVAGSARIGAKQVLDELARDDPVFAAERRESRRKLKAWQRERRRLASEVGHLQIPFVVAAVNGSEPEREAPVVVLQISNYLFENDAPAELIRDLLRVAKQWLQGDGVIGP
jgi:hypothetical protein